MPLSSPYWKTFANNLILATDQLVVTLPGSFLHKGENKLVLTAVRGMHFQYDDLQFVQVSNQPPSPVVDVRLSPTVLYRALAGNPEVAELTVRTSRLAGAVRAEVHIGGFVGRGTVAAKEQEFGDIQLSLDLPSDLPPQPARILVWVGKARHEVTVRFSPAKKWLVYAAPASHDDVGYRETQPRTREWLEKEIDDVIALRTKYPWYKFNMEASWTTQDFLAHRSDDRGKVFLDLAREGEIGINAFYANFETEILSTEELARALYSAANIHRRVGVPMDAATLSDVPSASGALPTFLANAGIKFFAEGGSAGHAPLYRNAALAGKPPLFLRSPFFWEGPDGSRVLTWMSVAYAQLGRLVWGYPRHDEEFFIVPRRPSIELDVLHKTLPLFLLNYTRESYPYDAILLYGLYGDDHPFGDGEAPIIADWNSRYAYPKIVVSRFADFADHILKNYRERIPVIKGDMGAYWGEGNGSAARETAWGREAQVLLPAAEEFGTIATLLDARLMFPIREDRQAWETLLRFDEHSWDDELVFQRPESERAVRQEQWKSDMARDALLHSRWLQQQVQEQLRERLEIPFQTVAVFNPLSWRRDGPVDIELEPGQSPVESASRTPIPYAIVSQANDYVHARFWASGVPALGYKVYQILPSAPAKTGEAAASVVPAPPMPQADQSAGAQPPQGDVTVEGKYYRLRLDGRSGSVRSLFDRRLGRELVDSGCPYGLNEYLYVAGGDHTNIVYGNTDTPSARAQLPQLQISTQQATRIETIRVPWGTRILVTASATHTPELKSEIDVYDTSPKINITNHVKKDFVYRKEAAYFAFPFAASDPNFFYQLAAGWFRPNQDHVPGAAKEYFVTQHAIRIVSGSNEIVWATRDAPLVTFQDIVRGRWPIDLPLRNGWVFSYVMNNYWWTHFRPAKEAISFSGTALPARQRLERGPLPASAWKHGSL